MKIATDINCFYQVYTEKETVKILAEAGFEAIDYTFMDKRYYNGEISDSECRRYYTELKKYACDQGVYFNQSHAPCPSGSADEAQSEILFENIVRSLRNASYMDIPTIVVHGKDHIKHYFDGGAEKLFEENMAFYRRLKPYCEEYGIRVALENLPQMKSFAFGEKVVDSVCAALEEFIRYLDTLDSDCFTACLDIGHAMITGHSPQDFIRSLGKERLTALHVHDNNGQKDWHTLPFEGGMADWKEIMKALKEIGYTGDLTLEAGNFLISLPKELYPSGARMMADTGKYLRDLFEKAI